MADYLTYWRCGTVANHPEGPVDTRQASSLAGSSPAMCCGSLRSTKAHCTWSAGLRWGKLVTKKMRSSASVGCLGGDLPCVRRAGYGRAKGSVGSDGGRSRLSFVGEVTQLPARLRGSRSARNVS